MKTKHLLWLAIVAIMPLISCSAKSTDDKSSNPEVAYGNNPAFNTDFLKNLEVDVANIPDLSVPVGEQLPDYSYLKLDQVFRLLPMVKDGGYELSDDIFFIKGAKALAGGYTMLLYGFETGDDASLEMLAVYDKDGKISDYIDLGDMEAFIILKEDEDSRGGTARSTSLTMSFPSAAEFALDRTVKEGGFQFSEERASEVTDCKMMIESVLRYTVDDKGHLALAEEKEVRRSGAISPKAEYGEKAAMLSLLPMSDPGRIDRLNGFAKEMLAKVGCDDCDEGFCCDILSVVQSYYDSNPQALLEWIYEKRDVENEIVKYLKKTFDDGWRNKHDLTRQIGKLADAGARNYLENLTDGWASDAK